MSQVDMKTKTTAELGTLVDEASKALFELNIKKMTGASVSPHLFQAMRRQRARALTQLTQLKKAKAVEGEQHG